MCARVFAQTSTYRVSGRIRGITTTAWPSGPVDDTAFERLAGRICAAVAAGCDELHGSTVTRSYDDAEGEFLARIRMIAPQIPVGVSLDMHANISARIGGDLHNDRRLPDVFAQWSATVRWRQASSPAFRTRTLPTPG